MLHCSDVLPYECFPLDDNASALLQPKFMRQRVKSLPDEYYSGSFEDSDIAGFFFTGHEFGTHRGGPCGSSYNGRDSSGSESVNPLERSPGRCSEVGDNEGLLQSHFSGNAFPVPCEMTDSLRDVYPFQDFNRLDGGYGNSFYRQLNNYKTGGSWVDEEVKSHFIKKEFPSSKQFSGDQRLWPSECGGCGQRKCQADGAALHGITPFVGVPCPSQEFQTISPSMRDISIPARKLTDEQNRIRKIKVARYLEKRKKRTWGHKIRYASRKAYAENRPRIKGRFARQSEVDALKHQKSTKGSQN